MAKTFEQGKDEIARKVEHFTTNRQSYHDPRVKEADVRQSLIDPLFEALGWDVRNVATVAPQYREVVPEPSLDDEGRQKKPDYAFRVGQTPKFYAEAKKCSVNIDADAGPAFQLRGYGWSAKVVLSMSDELRGTGRLRLHARAAADRQGGLCADAQLSFRSVPRPLAGALGPVFPRRRLVRGL